MKQKKCLNLDNLYKDLYHSIEQMTIAPKNI